MSHHTFLTFFEDVHNPLELTWLVMADVNSLYTVIPNKASLHAVIEDLHEFRLDPRVKPSNDSFIQLLEFVLTQNNFKFNGEHYLQVGATSIATKAALSYADIFMGKFKEDFVYTYPTQPLLWKRYIDDCFFIWTGTKDSFNAFLKYLNSCDPSIIFTFEKSHIVYTSWTPQYSLRTVNPLTHTIICSSPHLNKCKETIPYS